MVQRILVFPDILLKKFHNLRHINIPNLHIGDCQFHLPSLCFSPLGQITGGKEQAPDIINRLVNLRVCELLMNFFHNDITCYQALDLPFGRSVCRFFYKPLHCVITAGIDPVVFRLYMRFASDPVTMVQHIPRAVHRCISKLIPVIPLFYFLIMIRYIIIFQEFSHFFVCKAKVLIKTLICNR